jgi:thiamine-phosphate pyrophosphorylase
MMRLPARGLYALTDATLTRQRGLIECVEAVLDGGAVMVQYRDKSTTRESRLEEATALVRACHRHAVPLIVNDDAELALAAGADGVHVGRDDWSIRHVRELMGPRAIVGASCYHDLDAAERAVEQGADYVAFGRCFPSRTKSGPALATPQLLREATGRLHVPVCAIGGITALNAADLVALGVGLVAVIHDLWGHADCAARARAFRRCFD